MESVFWSTMGEFLSTMATVTAGLAISWGALLLIKHVVARKPPEPPTYGGGPTGF